MSWLCCPDIPQIPALEARLRRTLARALAALPALVTLSGCSVGYLGVQGVYQLKMLRGREPIVEVLERPDLPPEQRAKLALILDIQAFARDALGMDPSGTYTTVNLGWDVTIYNVSGCEPLAFKPHTWWFPIVGRVPYKGFFREEDARRQHEALEDLGLDVVTREVGAYSTLGFFDDPVLPDMLTYGQLGLVDLILHELAHGVLYFRGQVEFNESFASFVGKQGSFSYLRERAGPGVPTVEDAEHRYRDQDRHQAFMLDLYARLDQVYIKDSPPEEKQAAKEAILAAAPGEYAALPFESAAYQGRALEPLNNAHLMSYRRYHSGEAGFRDLLDAVGGSWPAFFSAVESLEGREDPFAGVQELAAAASR